ncbi:MAG: transglutaminase family protein [Gemmobacter sp.]|nr:transglutaminase family protein [Gemmobacter sp.]
MLYDIRVSIRYDYDRPAAAGRHLLRLLPASLPGQQRLLSGQIAVSPEPAEQTGYVDFFGNPVTEIVTRPSQNKIIFTATARVDRFGPDLTLDMSPPLSRLPAELADITDLGPESPHHFLSRSPRIAPLPEAVDWARQVTEGADTVADLAERLNRAMHAEMKFDPKATTVDTPPAEAFEKRRGVCQDFAQVMIAALRGMGVPAGYVSGFLRTVPPPGKPRLEGADAMHAWVRVWCGTESGWIGFDPTNACRAGADHITVAHGRDYGDVTPVAGILRISGRQKSSQAVDVIEVK